MDFTNSKPPKKIKRNGPSMGLESVGELLKNDWFNLDGLVGLMAVRHATQLWLATRAMAIDSPAPDILAVKPAGQGCRLRLGVHHSTALQQWHVQMAGLKAHLNQLAPQTHWPVADIRLIMI
jgi:hypothetical protein